MIKAGIIGGSGYTGGELIRLLHNHPEVSIDFVFSTTKAGKKISGTHTDLLGIFDLPFTDSTNSEVDILFLCLGHGNSKSFLNNFSFSPKTRVIDLSNDFRLKQDASFRGKEFLYGLPELNSTAIRSAGNIANPGCFATCIQLALLPLAKAQLLNFDVHVNAVTGSTGAGIMPSATTHFSWRNNNASWYKAFTHQHLGEINESLESLQETVGELYFIPNRGNFSRGILSTAYTKFEGSEAEAYDLYREFYKNAVFTKIADENIHIKQVVNTNNCHIHLHKYKGILLITSVIDNLLKGASGQAIQNMNLMFGFDENAGLNLKAAVY
jgi:N-acetyl-gamma-glutamyl-phosphate reductase